ncbi:4-hydroxybenzoate octaprenyltransferase [Laribacter hongkongensis]|uniref:4-hydroxybenzoate octaprenyltransferase n=1 Tax=Laribacter hongkongensis TaxID=168471 RepID=A0AAW5DVX0_9NEIS|nr:4-hydroxybenzoate octaprenyltransferase [Laribacter hongkongensis]MBE5527535.1 4-hydroxybenzoate polyprenyltransferase [Laribacter hongkongensis]MCG8991613.1 4-hydroxybenzoate octaprenyltransferase [Laribacter hongkongensis]MCG8995329.1 4-hydroxybenzoate octaprenyltransferase [Laribacter hongkongensis]MCG8996881.1 4-hydroxybenzoate octaprenyltransferase [Laribacter hongkongensis]MCG9002704.1 4-hydroxybenzoate octaprenyltransferase [Laribacter hongkongensis]
MNRQRLLDYCQLMRIDKPIGTLLLLWPTLWALWLAADGLPPLDILAIFVAGTFLMRAAGCVVNDLADRDIDGAVERTRQRPFARGAVTPREALLLAAGLALLALLIALPLNRLALLLTLPALFLAVTYPFTKRFFPIPQAYLGLAFGFGIPMAFAAVQGHIPPEGWWLFVANIFWVLAYDTCYAITDKPDDLKIGIRTSAITFGRFDVAAVALCQGLFLLLMAMLGRHLHLGWPFTAGLAVAAALIGVQLARIRSRDRAVCFAAFLDNNRVGLAVFAGIVLSLHWPAL